MNDNIFEATTGRHLAWVENGKVFEVNSEKQVATLRDGDLYSLAGELVGHVENAFQVHTSGTPDAFLKLLAAA